MWRRCSVIEAIRRGPSPAAMRRGGERVCRWSRKTRSASGHRRRSLRNAISRSPLTRFDYSADGVLSGTTLAVTLKLLAQGRIKPDETVVVSITGNGYKTLEAVASAIDQPSIIDARRAPHSR